MMDFRSIAGYEAVLAYQTEDTSLNSYNYTGTQAAPTLPAAPSDPIFIGYANVPGVKTERGNKKGYGIGSPFAVYNGKGTRRYEVTIDAPLTGTAFLGHCLRGATGYKGLSDLCLFVGAGDEWNDGAVRAIRMAKCNTFTLAMNEGSAQEIRLQTTFMGLHEQAGPLLTPTSGDLVSAGAPYFWNTVMTVDTAGGIHLRDVLSSVSISGNHNLKPRGFRPGTDESNPMHLAHYSLVPGKFVGRASLGLHNRLDETLRAATANATNWGDITLSLQSGTKTMTIVLQNCILDPDSQNAGDDGDNAIGFGCDILFSNMTVSGTSEIPAG
jgi:hypothetical protein